MNALHTELDSTDSTSPCVLLNAPVLTNCGQYEFQSIDQVTAHQLIRRQGFISAIGHAGAAQLLSRVFDIDCPMRRIEHRQLPGELAIVLRLGLRLPEGFIVDSADELEQIGYSFALLRRLS